MVKTIRAYKPLAARPKSVCAGVRSLNDLELEEIKVATCPTASSSSSTSSRCFVCLRAAMSRLFTEGQMENAGYRLLLYIPPMLVSAWGPGVHTSLCVYVSVAWVLQQNRLGSAVYFQTLHQDAAKKKTLCFLTWKCHISSRCPCAGRSCTAKQNAACRGSQSHPVPPLS